MAGGEAGLAQRGEVVRHVGRRQVQPGGEFGGGGGAVQLGQQPGTGAADHPGQAVRDGGAGVLPERGHPARRIEQAGLPGRVLLRVDTRPGEDGGGQHQAAFTVQPPLHVHPVADPQRVALPAHLRVQVGEERGRAAGRHLAGPAQDLALGEALDARPVRGDRGRPVRQDLARQTGQSGLRIAVQLGDQGRQFTGEPGEVAAHRGRIGGGQRGHRLFDAGRGVDRDRGEEVRHVHRGQPDQLGEQRPVDAGQPLPGLPHPGQVDGVSARLLQHLDAGGDLGERRAGEPGPGEVLGGELPDEHGGLPVGSGS